MENNLNNMKFCDVGKHSVVKLFHARKPDRPSCCVNCLNRQPIKKTPIKPVVKDITFNWHKKNGSKPSAKVAKLVTKPHRESLPEVLKLAEIVFNKWIRDRDNDGSGYFKCISCNEVKDNREMEAGHYMAKTYSATRFDENNVFAQCHHCNCFLSGNHEAYRENLTKKIGLIEVMKVEYKAKMGHRWDREELLEIIKKFKI